MKTWPIGGSRAWSVATAGSQWLSLSHELVHDGTHCAANLRILNFHGTVVLRRPDVDQRCELNAIVRPETWPIDYVDFVGELGLHRRSLLRIGA